MPILHKLIGFFRDLIKVYNIRWLKFLSGSVKKQPFLLCQNQLCF